MEESIRKRNNNLAFLRLRLMMELRGHEHVRRISNAFQSDEIHLWSGDAVTYLYKNREEDAGRVSQDILDAVEDVKVLVIISSFTERETSKFMRLMKGAMPPNAHVSEVNRDVVTMTPFQHMHGPSGYIRVHEPDVEARLEYEGLSRKEVQIVSFSDALSKYIGADKGDMIITYRKIMDNTMYTYRLVVDSSDVPK